MASRPADVEPTVHRRRVSARLKQARSALGLTLEEVAGTLDWSTSKLMRIEGGKSGISSTDLRALLAHYGVVDEPTVAELVDEARQGRRRIWSSRHRELYSRSFLDFLEFESSAVTIKLFQPLVVPGLLQTDGYARAVIAATGQSEERVEALVAARLERQDALFTKSPRPAVVAVIDEGLLRRSVGGSAIMAEQIAHLAGVARAGTVLVRVLPFAAGAHPAMTGAFSVLELPDDVVVFSEGVRGDVISRDGAEAFQDVFGRLDELALSSRESVALLESLSDEFRHAEPANR